ncbi:MAG: ATP-binding cassette domain-containing protein, partial [Coprobacillus sp.]
MKIEFNINSILNYLFWIILPLLIFIKRGELNACYKKYKQILYAKKQTNKVLNNINLQLNDRCMTFILGKSGSGKSTLLNIIGGLDKPDSGEIIIDNKSTLN